jgi:hypothetical protein
MVANASPVAGVTLKVPGEGALLVMISTLLLPLLLHPSLPTITLLVVAVNVNESRVPWGKVWGGSTRYTSCMASLVVVMVLEMGVSATEVRGRAAPVTLQSKSVTVLLSPPPLLLLLLLLLLVYEGADPGRVMLARTTVRSAKFQLAVLVFPSLLYIC